VVVGVCVVWCGVCVFTCGQTEEQQTRIATELLDELVLEVISSNQKKPSVPGVILETIIGIVNGVIELESDSTKPMDDQSSARSAYSTELLVSVATVIVADIIDEVILSNNRQPSVPGVVLQLITEFITNTDSANNNQPPQPVSVQTVSKSSVEVTSDSRQQHHMGPATGLAAKLTRQVHCVQLVPTCTICCLPCANVNIMCFDSYSLFSCMMSDCVEWDVKP